MATRGSDQAYILYIWWSWSLTCLFSFQLNNSDLVKIMTKGNKLDQTVSETILWFAREFDSDARFENLNRTADRIRPKGNLNTVDDWRTILRTQVVPATTRALLIGFIGALWLINTYYIWWWRCTGQHTRMNVPSRRDLTHATKLMVQA